MPRVPVLSRQIGPKPLPDVRQSFTPSAASFGAGAFDQAASVALNAYAGEQEKARDEADQTALLAFDNQLAGFEHQRLHDPHTGVLNTVKGQAALDLPNSIGDEFDKVSSEAIDQLLPRQQLAAQRVAERRREGIISTLDQYGSREGAIYTQEQVDASLKSSVELGIANATDPQRVNTELQRQGLIVDGYAQAQGWSPELRDQKLADLRTATHVGVIHQLLALDKDTAAQTYFDATKQQIAGDKLPQLEAALEESGLRKQSQQQADAIGAQAKTLTAARDAVKAIDDPKLRDLVQQRVEHDWSVKETIDRQARESSMITAGNLIDNNQKIPSALWVSFTPAEKASLEAYQKRNLQGDADGKTDLPTYYGLMTRASTDPEAFANDNLLLYLGKLGKTEFKQLTEIQGSIRNGDRHKTETQLDGFRTADQVITDTLNSAGIATQGTDADHATIARFRATVDQQTKTLEHLTQKKASKDDIEKIANELLSRSVLVPGGWLDALTHPFTPNVKAKRLFSVTIDDIPLGTKDQITKALQKAGRAVTDDDVLRVYLASQTGGQK